MFLILVFIIFMLCNCSGSRKVYLDNNGTTPPYKSVVETASKSSFLGNPSGIYANEAKKIVEGFRSRVKEILHAPDHKVIVTSSGSESNNLIIRSCVDKYIQEHSGQRPRLIMSETEHKTSLLCGEQLHRNGRATLILIPVDGSGHVDINRLEGSISPDTCLVSIMHINNETGGVNDIGTIAEICAKHRVPFHSDIVQSFGKIPPDLSQIPINAVSISMHKLHGVLGVGALITDLDIIPQITGMQMDRLRGGTENVPGMAGSLECLRIHFTDRVRKTDELRKMKEYLIRGLSERIGIAEADSPKSLRIKILSPDDSINTVLLSVVGPRPICNIKMRRLLNESGIVVSIGSTCNTTSKETSHVLKAMKIPYNVRCGVLRISLSDMNTVKDCDSFIAALETLLRDGRY